MVNQLAALTIKPVTCIFRVPQTIHLATMSPIELTDKILFKEHYWQIPLHMYDNVKAHLQELLDIGTIKKSYSHFCQCSGFSLK